MTVDHLMTQTLSVYRPTATVDSGGGQVVTFDLVGTVRAKVNQPTAAEVQAASTWGAKLTHVVHTVTSEDVRRGDELGGDLPSEVPVDQRLRVLAAIRDSHATYLRLECGVMQPEASDQGGSSS